MIALARRARLTKPQQKMVISHQPLMRKVVREMIREYPILSRMDAVGIASMALVKAVMNCRDKRAIVVMVETVVRRELLTVLRNELPRRHTIMDCDKLPAPESETVERTRKMPIEEVAVRFLLSDLTDEQQEMIWKWAGYSHSKAGWPTEAIAAELGIPFHQLHYLYCRLRQIGREVTLADDCS